MRQSLTKLLRCLLTGLGLVCLILLLTWGCLAIYFSNLPWHPLRLVVAAAFASFGIWACWISKTRKQFVAFAVVFAALMTWWFFIPPSHNRTWKPDVAVMPRVSSNGDRVLITGYRHFEYAANGTPTIRHEEREIDLSKLTSLDFFISYWKPGPVGHTFLSFNFENAPPLCISIEARPEQGEAFAAIPSLFKQFELIYVVGDERDLVGSRIGHRNEQVYLYRLRTTPEAARRLLDVYLKRINHLADHPEFYHLLSNSCTINIARFAHEAGRIGGWDRRYLLNGLIDRYLYEAELVDTSLPFEKLRGISHINPLAGEGADSNFSKRIREGLPIPPSH